MFITGELQHQEPPSGGLQCHGLGGSMTDRDKIERIFELQGSKMYKTKSTTIVEGRKFSWNEHGHLKGVNDDKARDYWE